MGAWGYDIRECDATGDWEYRWGQRGIVGNPSAIVEDIENNNSDAEDKALGYLMLGQLIIEGRIDKNAQFSNSLKTKIMRAAIFEVDSGSINNWDSPAARLKVLKNFTDKIFDIEATDD